MKFNLKELLINIFFIATTITCLYTVIVEDYDLKIVFKPLPLVGLTFLYISRVTKLNYWILTSLLLSIIADAILTINQFIIAGILLFTIIKLILIKVILSYFRNKIRKIFYRYFIMFMLVFLVIFLILFSDVVKGTAYYITFLYGIVTSLLAAVAFGNYLARITKSNLLLFFGVFLNVISNCIFGVDLFGTPSIYFTFSALLLYFVSQYVIYSSLLLKSK